jgi:hypothetical protein
VQEGISEAIDSLVFFSTLISTDTGIKRSKETTSGRDGSEMMIRSPTTDND